MSSLPRGLGNNASAAEQLQANLDAMTAKYMSLLGKSYPFTAM